MKSEPWEEWLEEKGKQVEGDPWYEAVTKVSLIDEWAKSLDGLTTRGRVGLEMLLKLEIEVWDSIGFDPVRRIQAIEELESIRKWKGNK